MAVEEAKSLYLNSRFDACVEKLGLLRAEHLTSFFSEDVIKNDHRIFHLVAELDLHKVNYIKEYIHKNVLNLEPVNTLMEN